jgi:hypothetical protein
MSQPAQIHNQTLCHTAKLAKLARKFAYVPFHQQSLYLPLAIYLQNNQKDARVAQW